RVAFTAQSRQDKMYRPRSARQQDIARQSGAANELRALTVSLEKPTAWKSKKPATDSIAGFSSPMRD
ncbi:hypothetical protein, partial [Roseateles sp.]|uniref:hypothetical protein n=1 Tax=Roseateles sp. TaxID=1971397 RepID=UPI002869F897